MRLQKKGLAAGALAILIPITTILGTARTAQACKPAPPESYISSMKSILYGRATEVSGDQQSSTVEVISYVGPGDAPRIVRLPALAQLRSDCDPQSAGTFRQGNEYLILMQEIPSDQTVIPAEARIVLGMEPGMIKMDFQGKREPVESVLASFAQKQGLDVKKPAATPPVHQNDTLTLVEGSWWAGGTVVLGIFGAFIWRRYHR